MNQQANEQQRAGRVRWTRRMLLQRPGPLACLPRRPSRHRSAARFRRNQETLPVEALPGLAL